MPKLHVAPDQRRSFLTERRHLKMAESAHAYVRGNTIQFYEWLNGSQVSKSIPSGPSIWICGDCHVGNLGPVADVSGNVEIEIRDLDQTVIGNPAHDLLRLGLSLAMAARGSDLPGVTTALMIEAMLAGYVSALSSPGRAPSTERIAPIQKVITMALNRKWRHLAQERIEDVTPQIPLGRKFWSLTEEERSGLIRFFEGSAAQSLMQCLHGRDEEHSIKMLDAAYWMKGCSSLGRLRYAVLVALGKKNDRRFCLLDIKEATAPAAPSAPDAVMPANNAERVVTGARHLSPYLGERMFSSVLAGKDVVIRELRPQDLKFELDALTQGEAILTARLLASVVGRAHRRQLKSGDCQAWSRQLKAHHAKGLDAPSWLWTAVLDLVANHESAYLEHCRRYALSKAG